MKRVLLCLVCSALGVGKALAQKASTGTVTSPGLAHPSAVHSAPAQVAGASSAASQQRRALILQQRQDRIQFEQQYKVAMQSLESSVKGQTAAQQSAARAQAQQQWRTKRKTMLDGQRQARGAPTNAK